MRGGLDANQGGGVRWGRSIRRGIGRMTRSPSLQQDEQGRDESPAGLGLLAGTAPVGHGETLQRLGLGEALELPSFSTFPSGAEPDLNAREKLACPPV
jgi:hypothetical protein